MEKPKEIKAPNIKVPKDKSGFGMGMILGLIFIIVGILLVLVLIDLDVPLINLGGIETILEYGAAIGSILGGAILLFKKH